MNSDKKYKCDILNCNKCFKTKYSLKRHMKTHKINKEFKCSRCNKQFTLQQYLTEHEFTHTRAKPFACEIGGCQESFRQRGKRSLHQALVHGIKKRQKPVAEGMLNEQNSQILNNKMLQSDNHNLWE
jgi:uncharacterized Zn-finger protein